MITHFEQKTLPYSAEQMFDLVADVSKYREFVPWCIGSRINRYESDSIFYADLVIGYKMVRERFSSRVILDPHKRLHIEYLEGPLKHLSNEWIFVPDENGGCCIDFTVEFEFSNFFLQSLVHMFFNEVVKRMIGAFETRANELYG